MAARLPPHVLLLPCAAVGHASGASDSSALSRIRQSELAAWTLRVPPRRVPLLQHISPRPEFLDLAPPRPLLLDPLASSSLLQYPPPVLGPALAIRIRSLELPPLRRALACTCCHWTARKPPPCTRTPGSPEVMILEPSC